MMMKKQRENQSILLQQLCRLSAIRLKNAQIYHSNNDTAINAALQSGSRRPGARLHAILYSCVSSCINIFCKQSSITCLFGSKVTRQIKYNDSLHQTIVKFNAAGTTQALDSQCLGVFIDRIFWSILWKKFSSTGGYLKPFDKAISTDCRLEVTGAEYKCRKQIKVDESMANSSILLFSTGHQKQRLAGPVIFHVILLYRYSKGRQVLPTINHNECSKINVHSFQYH